MVRSGCNLTQMRILLAICCAAIVFLLTYMAAWVEFGESMNRYVNTMWLANARFLDRHLSDYRLRKGEYPTTLEELGESDQELREMFTYDIDQSHFLADPWARPLRYERTAHSYELCTLGRDGSPGGFGLDADLCATPGTIPTVLPTLQQFLTESGGSRTLFQTALIASLCAGAIAFRRLQVTADIAGLRGRVWLNFMVVTILSCGVAIVLALFYIEASQSGH